MNEKMLELARQAGLKKDHGSDREYIGDLDWRELASLIVAECAKCCTDYSDKILRFSQFGSNAARDCADIISNHFNDEQED